MKIKNVTSKDLREIYSLEKKVFKENAFSKTLLKKSINNSTFFLKLEKDTFRKVNIGFVIAVRDRLDRVNIINFLINPKYQNMGYGAYLLENTIKRIEQLKGIKQIVLNVQVNNLRAINLYHKFGFKIIEKIDHYYRSRENAYLMILSIKP
ncbi:MAG: GNAT family N-acetyltransferase [Promethearchaeota archaeon]|nr:MAG: GNAT family N-acetyltransferase [Candidatus Lokiarchaeota archaeon]